MADSGAKGIRLCRADAKPLASHRHLYDYFFCPLALPVAWMDGSILGMRIHIHVDLEGFDRASEEVLDKQVRPAIAAGLNVAAVKIKDDLSAATKTSFDRPHPFTVNAFHVLDDLRDLVWFALWVRAFRSYSRRSETRTRSRFSGSLMSIVRSGPRTTRRVRTQ